MSAQARNQLQRLYLRDKGLCHYCGARCWLKAEMDGDQATRDHAIPRSVAQPAGGLRALVLACRACNKHKGNILYDDYRRQFPRGSKTVMRKQGGVRVLTDAEAAAMISTLSEGA